MLGGVHVSACVHGVTERVGSSTWCLNNFPPPKCTVHSSVASTACEIRLCCFLPCHQVYAVALYVEAELCAKELGIRYRGGFFENDDDFCSAIVDGAFNKNLVVSSVVVCAQQLQSHAPKRVLYWAQPVSKTAAQQL